MEAQLTNHTEPARSENEEDLKVDDESTLADPDTAGLPEATDESNKHSVNSWMAASCGLKILVSNNVAGSLIGKAGSSINDIQTETGARIKLSQSHEFFPGTQYRVVLITGSRSAVLHASTIVWDKIAHDVDNIARRGPAQDTTSGGITGRISVPYSASGLLIGRNGVTIRQMIDESGAKIQLSNKDESTFTQERVVTITGAMECCLKCIDMLLDKLLEDPKVGRYANLTTSYARAVPQAQFGYAPGVPPQVYPTHPHPTSQAHHGVAMMTQGGRAETISTVHTIQMAVNDAYMGFVLGKNGSSITEIQNLSRARVVVSPRGEYVPGTTNRTVTITGSPMAANTAHYLILQRLAQVPGAPLTSAPQPKADHLNVQL